MEAAHSRAMMALTKDREQLRTRDVILDVASGPSRGGPGYNSNDRAHAHGILQGGVFGLAAMLENSFAD